MHKGSIYKANIHKESMHKERIHKGSIHKKYTQREYAQIRIRMKNSMELLCNYDIIKVSVINNQ